jgi:hypothetical protein
MSETVVVDLSSTNRQARREGAESWFSYGNVSYYEACRKHAVLCSLRSRIGWSPLCVRIECRCESEPDKVTTVEVRTTVIAEVLNPRQGAE